MEGGEKGIGNGKKVCFSIWTPTLVCRQYRCCRIVGTGGEKMGGRGTGGECCGVQKILKIDPAPGVA